MFPKITGIDLKFRSQFTRFQGETYMNSFEVKCYEKTYQDPQYWDDGSSTSVVERQQMWAKCRAMTNHFYEELIARGYLVPKSSL